MNKAKNRIAIFASFSKDNRIHDYVTYYLRELKKVCENIIFVADCDIEAEEQEKIKDYVVCSICKKHGEYDFGSYRKGFEWAEQHNLLDDKDELIFCNDSCYGPVLPFEHVFETMEHKKCDYWGLTESHEFQTHLQSFFLVFKKNVYVSEVFRDYVNAVEKQSDVWDVILNYEVTILEKLSRGNFKYAAYISTEALAKESGKKIGNPVIYPISTINLGMPLVKRKVFLQGYDESLQESLPSLVSLLENKNKELHDIIINDLANLYSGIDEVPQNVFTETAFFVEKHLGGQMAVNVLYRMVEETLKLRSWLLYTPSCDNCGQVVENERNKKECERLRRKYKKYKRLTKYSVVALAITLACLIVSFIR